MPKSVDEIRDTQVKTPTPPPPNNVIDTTPDLIEDPAVKALEDIFNSQGGGGGGGQNGKLKALAVKEAKFKQETGLRDIEQNRELALKGAINNALQRGIFHSGIRTENEQLINRESDEAASDLKTQIKFALDRIKAGGSGGGGIGGGISLTPGQFEGLLTQIYQEREAQRQKDIDQSSGGGGRVKVPI